MANPAEYFKTRRAYIFRQSEENIIESTEAEPSNVIRVQMDATTSFSLTSSGSIAKHPVADNSSRADHVTINNDVIELTGVISDSPLYLTSGGNRKIDATEYVKQLKEIKENKELVTAILPSIGSFSNCFITHVRLIKDKSVGNGLKVSLKLEKLLIGSNFKSKTVRRDKEDKTDSLKSEGNQSTSKSGGGVNKSGIINTVSKIPTGG